MRTRKAFLIGAFLEMFLFCWVVYGHVLYYSNSDCNDDAPNLHAVLFNILIIAYVRLMQFLMIVFACVICCPVVSIILICARKRRARRV